MSPEATGDLTIAKLTLQMTDDISVSCGKMRVGHGGLLLGYVLVALHTLPDLPAMSFA